MTTNDQSPSKPKLTVRGAAALGVGAMVGAGIFALLGEVGAVAGAATWLSFLLAGGVAALLGYVVAKLGAHYPSQGGLVTYLMKAFGSGHLVGVFSWLLYFSAVIVTAMVAVSFGSYAAEVFSSDGGSAQSAKAWTAAALVLVTIVQIFGAEAIGKVQSAIVIILLVVFAIFIVATVGEMDTELLSPSLYPPGIDIIASIALSFFAYLGFAVISYTGGDLDDPERDLPRATYVALAITTVLYVLISIGVFGTLTTEEVAGFGETALAEAARPVLGDAGFAMMAIAALLATFSSANANIYGASGLSKYLADTGEFPPVFGRRGKLVSSLGLPIAAVLTLLLAVLVDLTAIASLGSMVGLVIFLMVAIAGMRLRAETGSNAVVVVLAIVTTLVVLLVFGVQTLVTEPQTFVAMIGLLALGGVLEYVWSVLRQRRLASAGH